MGPTKALAQGDRDYHQSLRLGGDRMRSSRTYCQEAAGEIRKMETATIDQGAEGESEEAGTL